jgi:deoxyxylulose-5-phosphate synthase
MAGEETMMLNFGRITGHTDKMIKQFQDLDVRFDVVDMRDVDKLAKCVAKGVHKSIFKTMTFTQAGMKSVAFAPVSVVDSLLEKKGSDMASGVSLKNCCILQARPSADEWKSRSAVKAHVIQNKRAHRDWRIFRNLSTLATTLSH